MSDPAQLLDLLSTSDNVLILQADNPDGDSLASSLALEEILGEMGKSTYMYCSINVPDYLKHMSGWSRVRDVFPSSYDVAIMVDNSYSRLLHNLTDTDLATLKAKRLVILDHHGTETDIDFANLDYNDPACVSTGQVIYNLATELDLPINLQAAEYITISTLSDTLGLTSEALTGKPGPLQMLADLVARGVDLSELNARRLEEIKTERDIVAYRGQLLQRIVFSEDGAIAHITIPHDEIKKYGGQYNPTIILDEMRMVRGVKLGVGFKTYSQGDKISRVTARIRSSKGFLIADQLAEHFGGGGHPYASGAKWEGSDLDFDQIKKDVLNKAHELLDQLEQ
ncbi:MAG: DHH family phosphoesterase [Patescibacteria group bacterium]